MLKYDHHDCIHQRRQKLIVVDDLNSAVPDTRKQSRKDLCLDVISEVKSKKCKYYRNPESNYPAKILMKFPE